jgi:hypothetical protein
VFMDGFQRRDGLIGFRRAGRDDRRQNTQARAYASRRP